MTQKVANFGLVAPLSMRIICWEKKRSYTFTRFSLYPMIFRYPCAHTNTITPEKKQQQHHHQHHHYTEFEWNATDFWYKTLDMIVSHLPIKWLLCIDAKSIWLCFAILYVERCVAQKNANERDHLIFIKSSKLLLSSNVFCVLALLMHCISRNLHTLFICVCFFSPHVFIHFFSYLYVCMYVEMNKTSMWALMDYHFGICIKDEEHTKENEFHFLFVEITFPCIYYKCDTVVWFLSPLHMPNRTKYKVCSAVCHFENVKKYEQMR